jgi:hypothetical protein
MPSKKIPRAELEEMLKHLSAKDRAHLLQEELTVEKLEATLANTRYLMKRDLWIGIPWFLVYSILLILKGKSYWTIGIFVMGMIYFVTAILTTGSYGLNRKREKVFMSLLTRLKK